ncbi:MAG: transcription elongation factor GreA [Clostridia bacterium]|nr:transcription elongation factor GreA [Clostridia bacterium]
MAKQVFVSQEGFEKMQAELEYLKTVKREEVKAAIKKAREYGDLSENSEYDEAKHEQGEVESRIVELEESIKNVVIIDDKNIKTDSVSFGSKVKVLNNDVECEYVIVGSTECDPFAGKISDESPIGKGLLGMKLGEEKVIETPRGNITVQVIGISR